MDREWESGIVKREVKGKVWAGKTGLQGDGQAITQVSQPRQPCWKPARRWKIKDLAIQIQQQGMTGWYFRVLKEGDIQAGDYLQLQERPFPEWTVAKCNDIMHNQKNKI